jgi:hypothetical protein
MLLPKEAIWALANSLLLAIAYFYAWRTDTTEFANFGAVVVNGTIVDVRVSSQVYNRIIHNEVHIWLKFNYNEDILVKQVEGYSTQNIVNFSIGDAYSVWAETSKGNVVRLTTVRPKYHSPVSVLLAIIYPPAFMLIQLLAWTFKRAYRAKAKQQAKLTADEPVYELLSAAPEKPVKELHAEISQSVSSSSETTSTDA